MQIKTEQVLLRQLIPSEGMAIKHIPTESYYKDGIYLGKEENAEDYIEVPIEEIPEVEEPNLEEDN